MYTYGPCVIWGFKVVVRNYEMGRLFVLFFIFLFIFCGEGGWGVGLETYGLLSTWFSMQMKWWLSVASLRKEENWKREASIAIIYYDICCMYICTNQ